MMDCNRIERYLSDYLEGELEEKLKRKVEEHLLSCPSCTQKLKDFKAITALLRELEPVQPPGNFVELLNEKLQNQRPQPYKGSQPGGGN